MISNYPLFVIVYENLLTKLFENLFNNTILVVFISISFTFFKLYRKYYYNNKDMASKIYETVKSNNTEKSIKLLENNNNYYYINIPMDQYGYTPFLLACSNANTELVKFMLENGANIYIKSYKNESAFYLACIFHIRNPLVTDSSCIRLLYYSMVEVDIINEPNSLGFTPIQLAANFGHEGLIKWLLKKKANVNLIPKPSAIALFRGYTDIAVTLIKKEQKIKLQ